MTQYRLDVDDDLWDDFKGTVRRNETINEVLTSMIDTRVSEE